MTALRHRRDILESIRKLRNLADNMFHPKQGEKDLKVEIKCKKCGGNVIRKDYNEYSGVCPYCNNHMKISGKDRFEYILDKGYKIIKLESPHNNPIDFPDYEEKLEAFREKTGLEEAVSFAVGRIKKHRVCIAVIEPGFFMGSMGTFVGEELTRAFEFALKKKLPLILAAASGGARMQEGIFSLMQMAKTAAIVNRFREAGLLYICILTNPSMGGVMASLAALGDIMIGEPDALIGFAGPRVIEQTIKEKLPEDFQRAEKLVECGFLDMVLDRKDQREVLGRILKLHRR